MKIKVLLSSIALLAATSNTVFAGEACPKFTVINNSKLKLHNVAIINESDAIPIHTHGVDSLKPTKSFQYSPTNVFYSDCSGTYKLWLNDGEETSRSIASFSWDKGEVITDYVTFNISGCTDSTHCTVQLID